MTVTLSFGMTCQLQFLSGPAKLGVTMVESHHDSESSSLTLLSSHQGIDFYLGEEHQLFVKANPVSKQFVLLCYFHVFSIKHQQVGRLTGLWRMYARRGGHSGNAIWQSPHFLQLHQY